MPVVRFDEAGGGEDEDQNGGDLDHDQDVVGAGRLADAADQNHRQDHDDEEGGNVEAEVPAGLVEVVARKVLQAGGQICRRDQLERRMEAEPVQQINNVGGKAHADAHVAEGVLQNQIPADDPGDEFAERDISVCVSRAGDGNHGRQFGVTEPGNDTNDGYQHQRKRQRRSRARPTRQSRVMNDEMQ